LERSETTDLARVGGVGFCHNAACPGAGIGFGAGRGRRLINTLPL